LWLAWTLATAASGAAIGAIQQAAACEGSILALLLLPVLFCAGIGLGAAQWLVLRGVVTKAYLWIPVTAIGWMLAGGAEISVTGAVAQFFGAAHELWELLAPEQTQFPGILVFGLVLGTVQALVLRRLAGAAWWVPASIAGVILATLGLASVHDALASVR